MRVGPVVGVCALFALVGCSVGAFSGLNPAEATGGVAGARLTGAVHGGQQAIVGAHVYLFAAGTTGYGGAGIAASASNASVSLLTAGSGTTLDTGGGATNGDYYVTTDSNGSFSITGDYTCAVGSQVYLYALGGNPGAGVNSAAGLMAVLGGCPVAGNFASATPIVMVNEVSTVAAAYAMAGFATDATHVGSSGTTLAQVGIANAFANAGNLVDLPSGTALATTPAGNGTVPQAEINTLANVLASCVNSTGTASSGCTTLLTNALSGGTTGTQPGDTASAAINVAHNPGANVTSLYALAAATPPFGPGLGSTPPDWTIAVAFTANGLAIPVGIAIDGDGSVWVPFDIPKYVLKLSSTGTVLSGSGFTANSMAFPRFVAIDPSGNAWVLGGGTLTKLSSSGSVLSGASGYVGYTIYNGQNSLSGGSWIAVDGSGNVWVPSSPSSEYGVTEFANDGTVLGWIDGAAAQMVVPQQVAIAPSGVAWITNTPSSNVTLAYPPAATYNAITISPGGGLNQPSHIAFDAGGNAWILNSYTVSKIGKDGTAISGSGGYSVGGTAFAMAIDGASSVWVGGGYPNLYLMQMSNSGSILSGGSGYRTGDVSNSLVSDMAVDGSGDVWMIRGGLLQEVIGVATPVVTPLSVGVKNNMLGTRP